MSYDEEGETAGDAGAESTTAAEWRALREALSRRLQSLSADRGSTTILDAISSLDRRIAGLAEHVSVLETEERTSGSRNAPLSNVGQVTAHDDARH